MEYTLGPSKTSLLGALILILSELSGLISLLTATLFLVFMDFHGMVRFPTNSTVERLC